MPALPESRYETRILLFQLKPVSAILLQEPELREVLTRPQGTEMTERERRYIPDNEFAEVCTLDMPSHEKMMWYILNPEKSDFPDAAARQKEWWLHGNKEVQGRVKV